MINNIPITFVTPWYNNFAGGAEVATRNLAEQLSRRGFNVQVLTTCCRSPFDSWWKNTIPESVEEINGVTVRCFPVKSKGEDLYHEVNYRLIHGMEVDIISQRQFVENSINSPALVEYAKTNTQGHLVIAIPYTQGLTYSLIQALEGRASIIPCFHDEPQFQWVTTAEMLDLSRHIYFLTEEEKSLSIKYYGRLIGRRLVESPVIGVGVELPVAVNSLLSKTSKLKDTKSHYNLPDSFFVYAGRKDIGKNILTLTNYFQKYRVNGGKSTLVFLGGGDSNLVPNEKGFLDLGFVTEEDKYLIISQSLGLINLSKNESFSLVLMEAWLCEIPVIVDKKGLVTTAHCINSQGGIPVNSFEEFELALKSLQDQEANKKLGEFGKRYVQNNYSWNAVLNNLLGSLH